LAKPDVLNGSYLDFFEFIMWVLLRTSCNLERLIILAGNFD
jgi:hypothetical protein